MKEGEDYIISSDPDSNNQDDWVVILSHPYDRLVGRYRNVEIKDKGTIVSFDFEKLYAPETCNVKGNEKELHQHLTNVLVSILNDHHEKRANIYYSMETGKRIEY